jgi:CelD/BcsL family acetyltransferase involved in cellulose biosynthesis
LKLEVIRHIARFLSIGHQWQSLAGRSTSPTPFQLPEWAYTWWKSFGSGELRVFAAWENDRLVGLLPCFLHSWNDRRQLTLVGTGISDYLGSLIEPAYADNLLQEVRAHLLSCTDWHVCDWQDLSEGDVLKCLKSSEDLRVTHIEDTPCMRRTLEPSCEEFLQNLSSGLRRNVRRYGCRLTEFGAVEHGVAHSAEPELVDAIVELHTREWKQRGGVGMVEQTGSGPFLRAVAEQFSRRDQFRIFYISLDGKLIACIYAIVHGGAAYGYMSGFDPDYMQFSLGTLVVAHAMQSSIREGLHTWDFLRGTESYKCNWGAQPIRKWRLRVERN